MSAKNASLFWLTLSREIVDSFWSIYILSRTSRILLNAFCEKSTNFIELTIEIKKKKFLNFEFIGFKNSEFDSFNGIA